MAIEIFRRREQKYVITTQQYEALMVQLLPHMRSDKNGYEGKYTVSSLYFENRDHGIYYETKNKLKYRQKLRLRVYDEIDIDGTAFFEVKQKHKKVVNKRRLRMTVREAYRYLAADLNEPLGEYETTNNQVLREIHYFRQLYQLYPEMIVSYDRHALHGIDDPELRMTFDFKLRCRDENLQVQDGSYGELFMDPNIIILEVKVNDSLPLWLTRILQDVECEQRGASKFCTSIEKLTEKQLANGHVYQELLAAGGR
ncbi:MAG TPA: polyphosphate polymerase domain-containing protein [Pseudogracilibacillus sp.]|nr:polyphosphate polymerase domain-containing protein [Pseudogracilibacillus sp.]